MDWDGMGWDGMGLDLRVVVGIEHLTVLIKFITHHLKTDIQSCFDNDDTTIIPSISIITLNHVLTRVIQQ